MTDEWTPELDDLLDEEKLAARRREAEQQYRDFTSDQIDYLRRRCKEDLFFLAYGPLQYDLLSEGFHGHVARWMKSQWGWRNRMILLPRDHYKSTIVTISDSVQMALPNVANVQAYPYSLGPNIKLLLSHEVREKAAKFLYEVTAAFTKKPLMLALFPEVIPSKRVHRINKWELELPNTSHHKEPTFDTIGAGGAAQGGHYNWLKLDDLVGEDARDSETVMGRVLLWFDNVNSLLTRLRFDGWDLIGTRWAYHDVYSHAMKRYGIDVSRSVLGCVPQKEIDKYQNGRLAVYARGAIEKGKPLFPEEFPIEELNVLRKSPMVWAAQYANNPLESGLNEFNYPLKFYNVDARGNVVVFGGEGGSFTRRLRELDICIFTDPSMGESSQSDPSGIVVTGTDAQLNIFILETVKARLRPPDFIDELTRLFHKYDPRVISIEEVAFSAVYRYWLEERATRSGISMPIRPYKPGSKKSKDARIRGLTHYFSTGQVYVAESMYDFRDEYEQYPMTDDEHLLDALAQGPTWWKAGLSAEAQKDYEKAAQQVMAERSVLTGY